jgi:hypothetical protein
VEVGISYQGRREHQKMTGADTGAWGGGREADRPTRTAFDDAVGEVSHSKTGPYARAT